MIFGAELRKVNTNLPPEELQALHELVEAQKEGLIVIKKCDKGGATAIMNRGDYIEGMMEHLLLKSERRRDGREVCSRNYVYVDPP